MSAKEVIAIDGPAGSGKSTTALRVAGELGFAYVDSGAYYRAATLIALRRGLADAGGLRDAALVGEVERMRLEQRVRDGVNEVLLDGAAVGAAIRGPEVTALVSVVAALPEVRRVVTEQLRRAADEAPVVMEGRDIGSVVFPEARLKVFLEASLEERARRRSAADLRDVPAHALARRDALDTSRAAAPLARAPDAVVLETDDLTLEEQTARIVALYRALDGPEA